uniref:TonB-dependent receptor domain-containing protein n=1 Tax=unclassified Roseovarius TaxID=2614913 RepID=UPI00273FA1FE
TNWPRKAIKPKPRTLRKVEETWGSGHSYSDTFRFQDQVGLTDVNGNEILPETAENYEIGLKFNALDGNLVGTAALFRTDKDNLIEAAPFPAFGRAVNIGSVRSEGFEFDLAGDLGNGWSFGAAYTYLDTAISNNENPALPKGTRLRNVPQHAASLRLAYEFNNDWRVFGAAIYESEKRTTTSPTVLTELPSYIRFDIGASKKITDDAEVTLFIENVTDEVYYTSAANNNNVAVGAPMNATLAFTKRF